MKKKYKVTITYKNLKQTSFDIYGKINDLTRFYKKLLKKRKILTLTYPKGEYIINSTQINDIQVEELGGK